MQRFDENTRVKLPATIQFMRLGYEYQSLRDIELDSETRVAVNRFKPAIERINNIKLTDAEVLSLIDDINSVIKQNDMGQAFYRWIIDPQDQIKLVDFDNVYDNDFAVVFEH